MNLNEECKPSKDLKYCFIPTCENNSKGDWKKFFAVPNSTKQEWCNAVGVTCRKRILYICEDHLNLEEDMENYRYWITMKGRPKLKSRLPQSLINIYEKSNEPRPSTSSIIENHSDTQHRPVNTNYKAVQVKPKTSDRATHCQIFKKQKTACKLSEHEIEKAEDNPIEEILPSTQSNSNSAEMSEVSSRVNVKPIFQGREFMLKLIDKKPQNYLGLPKKYYWLINCLEIKLQVKSLDIIMTLYKIKNNVSFYQISDMFEVSLATFLGIFSKTLHLLSMFFKQLIFSPSVLDVKKNLPSSFKANKNYSNVYCIIDCFEIEIEKPSNPINQSLTWSQYKNANTLKYLLATTPDGFVNFVSVGFGGRISDVKIVETSGFLDVLPPNCTVLANRGFKHVDTILSKKHIKLLRPPSITKDANITKQEAIKSKVIASLLIHVGKVIRRVRLYKFLKPHSVINKKLIQHADEAIIVACGLINLHSPIIK